METAEQTIDPWPVANGRTITEERLDLTRILRDALFFAVRGGKADQIVVDRDGLYFCVEGERMRLTDTPVWKVDVTGKLHKRVGDDWSELTWDAAGFTDLGELAERYRVTPPPKSSGALCQLERSGGAVRALATRKLSDVR